MKNDDSSSNLTREEWLNKAKDRLNVLFKEQGRKIPKIRISCSWPSTRALSKVKRHIGECWSPVFSKDKTTEIFISPFIDDPIEAADTLLHELVHAVVGTKCGHRGAFKSLAIKLGMEGPMPSASAGKGLTERLNALTKEVGPYPHAALDYASIYEHGDTTAYPEIKKDSTRLIKVVCPSCKYLVRTTRKWLKIGIPTCYCRKKMVIEIK